MTIDFTTLPDPTITEELDYEQILESMLSDLRERDPAYIDILESDPGVKILEVAAARELILRQRINDALRATLLRYAGAADLDNLAIFYNVTRLLGETDEALRARVIERIQGSSAAGSVSWYRYHALTASPLVAEVGVDSIGPGQVQVTVLSTAEGGAADAPLLALVDAVVQSDSVRVVSDTITTVSATILTVNVAASVWLLPGTPATVFDQLEGLLRTAFAAESGLGRDVTLSWLIGALHQPGVQRVELSTPAVGVVCSPSQAPALGTIAITYAGRDR